MAKKWIFFIGIDVSKNTLDVYANEQKQHIKIENGSTGFKALNKWFKTNGIDQAEAIITFEHTGGYEFKLMQYLESKGIDYCRIPGLEIKNSMGMVRGKTDKVDAKRIAKYAYEKKESLKPSSPVNTAINELKALMNYRKKLVRESAGYKATISERISMYDVKKTDLMVSSLTKKIKDNDKLITQVEAQIFSLIKADKKMLLNYSLITSIKGIGKVNAIVTIVYTENFTKFDDARKYAVYCGIVPFDNSSGISINGRKKVSHLANKNVKQELNQAAKASMAHDEEIKAYAERLKARGKHYKVILNNIKFKLVLRMFAVVNKQEMYVEKYKNVA